MKVVFQLCPALLMLLRTIEASDYDYDSISIQESSCEQNITLSRDFPEYILQTPGYPNESYSDGVECRWNVTSMEYHHVHIAVEKIHLKGPLSPHCSDSDKIIFVAPMGSTIGKICLGSHKPPPISMRNFSVIFKAGDYPGDPYSPNGFSISLTAKPIYHLTCSKIGFELAMPKRYIANPKLIPYESYHLLDPNCRVVEEKKQILFRSFYDTCGTSYTPGVGYFNSVLMRPVDASKPVTRMAVHCRHPGRTFIVSSFYTHSFSESAQEISHTRAKSSIPTYSKLTNTLVAAVEGSDTGVRFHVSEHPHQIRFEVTNHICPADEMVSAKSCWITTTPHAADIKRYTFLDNGCSDPDNPIIRYGSSDCSDQFSLKAFTLKNNRFGNYYVHCEINLCSLTNSTERSRCNRTCVPHSVTLTPPTFRLVETGRVVGVVRDAVRGDELSSVSVIARNGSQIAGRTATSANGTHSLTLPVGANYTIVFEATGYHSATMNNIGTIPNQDTFLETILYIEEKFVGPGTVSGVVKNAMTGAREPGVRLDIRAGLNTLEGLLLKTVETNANGVWSAELETGYYTAQLSKSGFTTSTLSVTVLGGQTKPEQNGAISPTPIEGETRIVLTWGAIPRDIDAHLTGPNGTERFHIFWYRQGNVSEMPFSNLDVDDRNGDGPETVTINKQFPGTYRYLVHDYTNRNSTYSFELARSPVKVMVYRGKRRPEIYHVPQLAGTLWTVFQLDGNDVTLINSMSYQNYTGLIN